MHKFEEPMDALELNTKCSSIAKIPGGRQRLRDSLIHKMKLILRPCEGGECL